MYKKLIHAVILMLLQIFAKKQGKHVKSILVRKRAFKEFILPMFKSRLGKKLPCIDLPLEVPMSWADLF